MDFKKDKYKCSQYNVFHKDGDVQYMWNTYSSALLRLDKESQEYVKLFDGCVLADDNSTEFNILKDNGFIVYEKLDELGRIKLHEKQNLFSNNQEEITFVIAPGMECNYRCYYCFEADSDQTGVMTPEIAIDVASYICAQLENNPNIKQCNIKWFGGEPLLYIDIINIISNKVMEYTEQNNIMYEAGIITNGRFLSEEMLSKLIVNNIKKAQITLDGMCDTYCKSKDALPEDFNCVIDNILNSIDKINISVRLNIPDSDANEAITVCDFLLSQHKLLNKINIYFAFVTEYSLPATEAKRAYIDYVKNYLLWIDHMTEHYGVSSIKNCIPYRRKQYCGLIKPGNSCIGPRGEIYRCEHDYGNDMRITGDVWHGKFYNDAELVFYSTIDGSLKQKCLQCKYLPICMGSCMHDCISGYNGFDCKTFQQMQFKFKLLEWI